MKNKRKKITYTGDYGEMDGFKTVSEKAARSSGIPAAKGRKEARINIRLHNSDLEGLKLRAEEIGIPFQTLAASVLHQVATKQIRLVFQRSQG